VFYPKRTPEKPRKIPSSLWKHSRDAFRRISPRFLPQASEVHLARNTAQVAQEVSLETQPSKIPGPRFLFRTPLSHRATAPQAAQCGKPPAQPPRRRRRLEDHGGDDYGGRRRRRGGGVEGAALAAAAGGEGGWIAAAAEAAASASAGSEGGWIAAASPPPAEPQWPISCTSALVHVDPVRDGAGGLVLPFPSFTCRRQWAGSIMRRFWTHGFQVRRAVGWVSERY
jgi:hypothetical protein